MQATIKVLIATLFLSILSFSFCVSAADTPQTIETSPQENISKLVEGSYIITFKHAKEWEHPLIEPSITADEIDSERRIPFGQHSTGQSKENLATELNLRGTIAAYYLLNRI